MSTLPFPLGANNYERSVTDSYGPHRRLDRETRNPEGRSMLTGPILPTPGYEDNTRPGSAPATPQRVPRVHGTDAKAIYKRATSGTGVPFTFEVRGSGVFSSNAHSGKPPKNHMNENMRRIRRIMREKQSESKTQSRPMSAKDLWRSKQYDHVQSKVKQKVDEDTQRSASRPSSAHRQFLRAHENTGAEHMRSQSANGSRRGSVDSIFNKNAENNGTTKPDYVKLNTDLVKTLAKTRKARTEENVQMMRDRQEKEFQSYFQKQKGKVPEYIEKIKEKKIRDDHERRMNEPDPECPPGHVKMDPEKRLETLEQLHNNRAALEKKLGHLPIRNDSLTLRKTKEDIEKKIVELDEAIRIFSKPKVFVKIE